MNEAGRIDVAELVAQIRAEADAAPDPWVRRWGAETCRWLAAVPRWTGVLAARAGLPLPGGIDSVDGLVAAAAAGGVVRSRADTMPDGELTETFWVDDATRESWLSEIAPDDDQLARVRAIAGAVAASGPAPPITRAWLDLVRRPGIPDVTVVIDDVRRLVREDRLTEANLVVEAGAALGPVVGGGYGEGIARARRLVQRGHRDRRDQSLLTRFVRQPEQIEPLWEVLTAQPGEPWAIHLIGPGGVGKTMLLRHLAAGSLAADHGRSNIPVARVDFDVINPDFPVSRPLELLVLLADDFASWADTSQRESALRAFRAAADSADAAVSGAPASRGALIQRATVRFGDFVGMLPAPQVLVLDTCEELAKLYPPGEEAPAIARTFELLDAVHERCPTLRVVFAGRRYLARSGHGWALPESVGRRSVVSLATRDHLRLTELRGFDRRTAEEVLRAPHPQDGSVPSDVLVETMLRRSPGVAGLGGDPDAGRFNPFSVGLFREWWEDEPGLAAERVAAAGLDAYVELRIVGRLHDEDLEGLLPALAVLGRVDEDTLAGCLPAHRYDARDLVIEELAEQEWITVSIDMASDLRVLAVAPGLLPLLQDWAERRRRSETESARSHLVTSLLRRLHEAQLDALTPELVAAALRLSGQREAVTAWVAVEAAVEREGRWPWAESILVRVRGELERWDVVGDRPLLDAALSATELAARRRTTPAAVATAQWRRILDLVAAGDPDGLSSEAVTLRRRAAAAVVGAGADPAVALRALLAELRDPGCPISSVVGAIESALADLPRARRQALGAELEAAVETAAVAAGDAIADSDPALLAGALTCLSTLCTGTRRASLLDRAAAAAAAAVATGRPRRTWADRPMHDRRDLRTWVALHAAVAACADEESVAADRLTEWRDLALRGGGVDADRLASCCLELRAYTAGDTTEFERSLIDFAAVSRYDSGAAQATDAVHDEVRPLFVAAARTYFRAAEPLEARALLDQWRAAALSTREDDATVVAADRALLWLAAKMRWAGFRPSLVARALGSTSPPLVAAADALLRLTEVAGPSRAGWVPDNLDQDLRIAIQVLDAPSPELLRTALHRAVDIRARDPVTACQLATDVALAMRSGLADAGRLAAASTDHDDYTRTVDIVRRIYRNIAPDGALPEWGSTGVGIRADDPWAGWRARWALLDGSRADESASRSVRLDRYRIRGLAVLLGVFVILFGTASLFVTRPALLEPLSLAIPLLGTLVIGVVLAAAAARPSPGLLSKAYVSLRVDSGAVRAEFRAARWSLRWLVVGSARPVQVSTLPVDRGLPMDGWSVAGTVAGVFEPPAGIEPVDWERTLIDATSPRAPDCVMIRDVPGPALDPSARGVRLTAPRGWITRLLRHYRQPDSGPERARIVHLIGDPVETSVGPVLQVSSRNSGGTARESYWSSTTARPSAWLTVLQQTPDDDGWTGRDPAMAGVMRALAIDTARDSRGWVLAIPVLSEPLAEQVWERLGVFAGQACPTRLDLAALVADIKHTIASEGTPAAAVTLDVLLLGPWTNTR
jgi:hypothetical protein